MLKVKGHMIRAISEILGMSYSVIDGLVCTVTLRFSFLIVFVVCIFHVLPYGVIKNDNNN